MTRHKLVKSLNVDDELDDFDGVGYGDGDDGDISAEDKEQLQEGTAKVRSVIGPDVAVTDVEIQESLWHYYYNVEKTVNYILNQRAARTRKPKRTVGEDDIKVPTGGASSLHKAPSLSPSCCRPFSIAAYFKDAPWLNIPENRRGEILIEPLYPPGRLLGGASSQGKVSKLAALAAARKKKGNETAKAKPQSSTTSVALLDKLSASTSSTANDQAQPNYEALNRERTDDDLSLITQKQIYPIRSNKRQNSDLQPEIKQQGEDSRQLLAVQSRSPPLPIIPPIAPPSRFAKTLFDDSGFWQRTPSVASFQPYYKLLQVSKITNFSVFAGPSPDDVVLKAQNSKGLRSSKDTEQAQGGKKSLNGATQGVVNLAIHDSSKTKSKNLDVIAEFGKSNSKNAANFVVIGHVDAGKSTLMGRLLYDLKVVDQRTIDRYRKEAENIGKSSFALAWVLDQGSEERARGVTIDIAMNKFETSKTIFTILDAPGHRDFIPNMIAGASQADFAVLVIDASRGNFESGLRGQTKEHALLVRSMSITRMVVAVNKLDAISWSQDRYSEISTQISAFLTAAGFLAQNIAFVPCSGLTGENIVHESQNPLSKWYTGPTLLSLLESSEPISHALDKPLRLTINDIFRGGVTNPLSISGRLDAGSVQVGDVVLAMPASETASIRAIEVDSALSDWAVAGRNIVLHLSDIDVKFLKPGDIICALSSPVKNISSFTMKLLAFEHVMPMHVEIHRGRLHAPGRISQLVAVLDKSTGAVASGGKKVRIVKPGSIARVAVEMDDAVPLEKGARVVLRNGGSTVATGVLE